MKDLNITVENGVKLVELRTGHAPDIPQPKQVMVLGDITTPRGYLRNPCPRFDSTEAYIEVNKEKLVINLFVNPDIDPTDIYQGALTRSQDLIDFGINTGKSYTTFELAEKIKMNRMLFETKDTAMKLVTELRNFKAKVDKDIELSDDTRGNTAIKRIQAVESNIPESFTMQMPIFKGFPNHSFDVEVSIDPQDFSCTLISPDLADIQRGITNDVINDEVSKIIELFPNIRIFNV